MIDHLRTLLYPLGLLASLFFTLRFLFQWISSERKKLSQVNRLFWIFSLIGNGVMTLHGFIQGQFPVALLQSFGGAIAWRNLNLMREDPLTFRRFLPRMILIPLLISILFLLEGLCLQSFEWMRVPTFPWSKDHAVPTSFLWHLVGFLGMILFASRFWIQWWGAEQAKKSELTKPFWLLSLFGGLLSFVYFLKIHDLVNIAGYGVGLIPYIRNIALLKKTSLKPCSERLFLFAGEQSGDLLGGDLARELVAQGYSLYGVAGKKMREAGVELFLPIERFQVMGFSAVLKAAPRLIFSYYKIKNEILKSLPQAVVLIDYPDFNLRLAKALRRRGYGGKIIQYVSPTVWAWRKGRVKTIAKNIDLLLSILPFEKRYYEKTSLQVAYVGHPLSHQLIHHFYKPLEMEGKMIALFPGSRRHEIEQNLKIQLETASKLFLKDPHLHFVISCVREEWRGMIEQEIRKWPLKISILPSEYNYDLMKVASGAIAKSGTVILELALHGTPTVVTYPLSPLNYILGKYVFRIILPYYSLPNIILGRELFPEFIDRKLKSDEIASALSRVMKEGVSSGCESLKACLITDQGLTASSAIMKEINQHRGKETQRKFGT